MRFRVKKSLVETPVAQFAPHLGMTLDELIRAQPRVSTKTEMSRGNISSRAVRPADNSDAWIWILIIFLGIPLVALLVYFLVKVVLFILSVAAVIGILIFISGS